MGGAVEVGWLVDDGGLISIGWSDTGCIFMFWKFLTPMYQGHTHTRTQSLDGDDEGERVTWGNVELAL